MDISFATIQIAILALPGILWATIDSHTVHSAKIAGFRFWVKVLLFGVIVYAVLAKIYSWRGVSFDAFSLQSGSEFSEKADEIIWSIPLSFFMALFWTAGRSHQIFPKFLRTLKISDHSGCDDIWEYSLGKSSPVGNWVHFRDLENGLVYDGWVKAYSDGPAVRELLLGHVSVYDFSGEKLYDQHALYLSRPIDKINLEFCEVKHEQTN